MGKLPQTPRYKCVLLAAVVLAREARCDQVDSMHVLKALWENPGRGGDILRERGSRDVADSPIA